MSTKAIVYLFMFIGSFLGGMIPTLWGAGIFSVSSVFLTAVGGFTGIWVGYRLSH